MKRKRIVEDDEEIQMNKDMPLEKKVKVEGNTAVDLAIGIGRDLGDIAEGEADDEVKRLRELLEDDPKKLNAMDVHDVICYLKVDDIVDLALKSGQGKGSDDRDTGKKWFFPYQAESYTWVFTSLRKMVCRIEDTSESEFRQLYRCMPHQVFALLLLIALDSCKNRSSVPLKEDDRDKIRKLCAILPWKLFAHILSCKASLPRLQYTSEETHKPSTRAQREAAKRCEICEGKGKHIGRNADHCSFLTSVPKGLDVGPNYMVICRRCNRRKYRPDDNCMVCRSEEGKAVPSPKPGKAVPYFSKFGSAL